MRRIVFLCILITTVLVSGAMVVSARTGKSKMPQPQLPKKDVTICDKPVEIFSSLFFQ